MAAIHVAGVRGEPCGAVRWTAVQRTAPQGSPRTCVGVYQLLTRRLICVLRSNTARLSFKQNKRKTTSRNECRCLIK